MTDNDYQLFIAHVDDGCEGIDVLVKLNHSTFGSTDDDDYNIEESIKHWWLTKAKNDGWNPNYYDISVGGICRYSKRFVEMTKEDE